MSNNILRIDWTGYSGILKCKRYAWHREILRRISATRNPALGFGSAIHAGLSIFQQALMSGKQLNLDWLEKKVEDYFIGVNLEEGEHRTCGRAKEVLLSYMQNYKMDDFRVEANEMSGEKELGQVSVNGKIVEVIWQGRCDGIWRVGDLICVKDTKTTSYFSSLERERQKYSMSGQFKGYCWLFGDFQKFGPIRDAVVDLIVVRAPLIRPRKDSPPRTEFIRFNVHFEDCVIEQWQRETLREIRDWLVACENPPPPMNTMSCTWPKPCEYLAVCENALEADRMAWLESGAYQDQTWSCMEIEE